jgi:hypothetical protein
LRLTKANGKAIAEGKIKKEDLRYEYSSLRRLHVQVWYKNAKMHAPRMAEALRAIFGVLHHLHITFEG